MLDVRVWQISDGAPKVCALGKRVGHYTSPEKGEEGREGEREHFFNVCVSLSERKGEMEISFTKYNIQY